MFSPLSGCSYTMACTNNPAREEEVEEEEEEISEQVYAPEWKVSNVSFTAGQRLCSHYWYQLMDTTWETGTCRTIKCVSSIDLDHNSCWIPNINNYRIANWTSCSAVLYLLFNRPPVCLSVFPPSPPLSPLCGADGPACRGGLTSRPHAAQEEPDVLCHAT